MTDPLPRVFTDAQRMELRSYVQVAGEVIAQFWPMRTFIHHNPLHGLEHAHFEEAIKRATQLFGGRGYLSNALYRRYFQAGRIRCDDLEASIQSLAADKQVIFGGRQTTHREVLLASIIHGVTEADPLADARSLPEEREALATLASWLESIGPTAHLATTGMLAWEPVELPLRETCSAWCDRTLGTALVETINREMVKWCASFMDEGESTWEMPEREQSFYRAWKALAQEDLSLRLLGVPDAAQKIAALPDRPEDTLLACLTSLEIPKTAWEEYLAQHLAAMPGWTGYIKWRSNESDYAWQQQYPIDLVMYLSVRLFYERELVDQSCRDLLGISGNSQAIREYMQTYSHGYWLRRELTAGRLDAAAVQAVRGLIHGVKQRDHAAWETLGQEQHRAWLERRGREATQQEAGRLLALARALSVDPTAVPSTAPADVRIILDWLEGFPASQHGPLWLRAFEAGYRRQVLEGLAAGLRGARTALQLANDDARSRPLAQLVFCIDVRSEVFRRHLEHRGGYETLGLAGFFGVPLDYQPFGAHHDVAHCPVLLKPKNQIREVPRSYHVALAVRHKTAAQLGKAAHMLLHDLKENVITPYVMVEAIGWLFGLPFFGKTLIPRWYHAIAGWLKTLLLPSIATTLTVEKITREEAEEMVAAEQQVQIRDVLRQRFDLSGATLSPALLERIRQKAMGTAEDVNGEVQQALQLSPQEEERLYQELRQEHDISPRGLSKRLYRITHTGFSPSEQAYFVEAALRLMGLTSNFSRVVVFCAHGSTSQNNPYESALDCGACGGNQGLPNARAIAAMANKPSVRELLRSRGIEIPGDTHFFAAQHDTTSDRVRIVDLEDVPATHRKDLQRLAADLTEAGMQVARERGALLEPSAGLDSPPAAHYRARQRTEDWAQVRPEWGLSKNSVMVIGRRSLTQGMNLQGRSFLHSYDYRQDGSGKFLEAIMTAPLVVAQWINMEHYFSTVDNEVYGSGSKIYHNVVDRVGVMTGVWSDLRIGLPAQTVLNGPEPYHEPMRLLGVIEAPRARIGDIIVRQPLLEQLFDGGWMILVSLDPEDGGFYLYNGVDGWTRIGGTHDQSDTVPHERNQDCGSGRTSEVRY